MTNIKKPLLYLLSFIFLATIIIIIIVTYTTRSNTPPESFKNLPTPTVFISTSQGSNKVEYATGSMSKMTDIYTHLKPLSNTGEQARRTLVNMTNGQSGITYNANNFDIRYDKPFDIFDADLKSENVSQTKLEVLKWLAQQGITGQDVCNLPLTFIPSLLLSQTLSKENIIFNPIPDGC